MLFCLRFAFLFALCFFVCVLYFFACVVVFCVRFLFLFGDVFFFVYVFFISLMMSSFLFAFSFFVCVGPFGPPYFTIVVSNILNFR